MANDKNAFWQKYTELRYTKNILAVTFGHPKMVKLILLQDLLKFTNKKYLFLIGYYLSKMRRGPVIKITDPLIFVVGRWLTVHGKSTTRLTSKFS